MVEAKKSYMPFSHLFTKLCAIVGGIFTVLGVVDKVVFQVNKLFRSKSERESGIGRSR
jgi:hypothetical protein